ncbi:MAG: hypothetical protein JWM20_842 [Patescibacteria group bacterium]|nr:hypothetical protein [Patescibacteria group bacterium]
MAFLRSGAHHVPRMEHLAEYDSNMERSLIRNENKIFIDSKALLIQFIMVL